jgi:hypothetical protein
MGHSWAALPLPHYHRLSIDELSERIQCLTAHELHQLRAYEWVHLRRDDVLGLFESRLSELGRGVPPTGTPVVFIPRQASGTRGRVWLPLSTPET